MDRLFTNKKIFSCLTPDKQSIEMLKLCVIYNYFGNTNKNNANYTKNKQTNKRMHELFKENTTNTYM